MRIVRIDGTRLDELDQLHILHTRARQELFLHERQTLLPRRGIFIRAEHVGVCWIAVARVHGFDPDVVAIVLVAYCLLQRDLKIMLGPERLLGEDDVFLLGQSQELGIRRPVEHGFVQRL